MARRTRTRLPWPRNRLSAQADASFFEDDPKQRLRPDRPELSVFSPAEEAESHRRWNREMLRERFRGPMSGAEGLGLGISAASLAALANLDQTLRSDPGGEAAQVLRRGIGNADEILAVRKPTAAGDAEKPAITMKAGAPASQAFLDFGAENAFSSPLSSRAENGSAGVRRPAPRGSGGPPESRVSSAERVDAAPLRKPEPTTIDARGPLAAESASVLRGPMDADVPAAVFTTMRPDADGGIRERAEAETTTAAAKADGGRAAADAPGQAGVQQAGAPPIAAAKAEPRPGPTEAPGRDKANDASCVPDAKPAEHGRGTAAEATGRTKAKDAVVCEQADADSTRETAEAPAEARAKDVSAVVEIAAGRGVKPSAASNDAKAKDFGAVDTKADSGKGGGEATGPVKAKDAPVLVEVKAAAVHSHADALDHTLAKSAPMVAGTLFAADLGLAQPAPALSARTTVKDDPTAAKAGQILGAASTPVATKVVPDAHDLPAKIIPAVAQDARDATAKAVPAAVPDAHSGPAKVVPAAVPDAHSGPAKIVPAAVPDAHSGPAKVVPAAVPDAHSGPAKVVPAAVPDAHSGPAKVVPAAVPDAHSGPAKVVPAAVPDAHSGPAKVVPAAVPDAHSGPAKVVPAAVPDAHSGPAKVVPAAVPDAHDAPGKAGPAAVPDAHGGPAKVVAPAVPDAHDAPANTGPAAAPDAHGGPVKIVAPAVLDAHDAPANILPAAVPDAHSGPAEIVAAVVPDLPAKPVPAAGPDAHDGPANIVPAAASHTPDAPREAGAQQATTPAPSPGIPLAIPAVVAPVVEPSLHFPDLWPDGGNASGHFPTHISGPDLPVEPPSTSPLGPPGSPVPNGGLAHALDEAPILLAPIDADRLLDAGPLAGDMLHQAGPLVSELNAPSHTAPGDLLFV